ncbi:hypothetical protein SAMD00019534_099390 [Acytostelium subglobosum LB1]|uniref:hypothetical protein n=1 Tax=Acytostelium subglobosum LB1 TaxID=1410327 RepID=UPI000644B347|nr:hypothetical protein SAMD00019534_099390 [Acytostelium subglobosum LB1]GAM26764.1 hypothetical protein SAMD00019534_099390 [Acytostelium subglobosum LB1]|eukprot:XP_012750425.1 hypothetical protein SAMD00019534_099390 [Acytostelium subglobosum LB1]
MRVYLLQLSSRRWTLYCEKSEFLVKSMDLAAPVAATGTTTDKPKPTGRLASFVQYLKTKAAESKKEIDDAEEGKGMAGKLKTLLRRLEGTIHPEEKMIFQFSNVNSASLIIHPNQHKHNEQHHQHQHHPMMDHHHPKKTSTQLAINQFHETHGKPQFTIHYPPELGARRANRYARIVARQRTEYHKLWSLINICVIPISVAASILPGPNVFLAWNIYRLYSNLMAVKGGINLLKITNDHSAILYREQEVVATADAEQPIAGEIMFSEESDGDIETNLLDDLSYADRIAFVLERNNVESLAKRSRLPGLLEHIQDIERSEKTTFLSKPTADPINDVPPAQSQQ